MSLEKLEGQKGVLRILVYLYQHGDTNFQRIVDEGNLYDRIVRNSLPILKNPSLISTKIDKISYPRKNMIFITEKGKRIAEKLMEIEEIMREGEL